MQKKKKKKNKIKKKKKNKIKSGPDQTLYSVSSAELAQKVVKVKIGQIHSNEVFVGEFLQSLGYRFACICLQKKPKKQKKQHYALYHDISCLISSPLEKFAGKIKALFIGKYEKCFAVFPRTSMYPSQS